MTAEDFIERYRELLGCESVHDSRVCFCEVCKALEIIVENKEDFIRDLSNVFEDIKD